MVKRKVLIVTGTKVLSGHETRLDLVEDDAEPWELDGTHELIVQTEQMIEWIEHMGYVKLRDAFAGKDIHETGERS